MVKLFLFRGSRVAFLLTVLACIALFVLFYTSPDIRPFSNYVESKIKKELQAEQCSISNLELAWDAGPVIDFGHMSITKKDLTLQEVSAQLSFSFFRMLRGGFAPQLSLSNGIVFLDLDKVDTSTTPAGVPISLLLDNIQLNWILHQEKQVVQHLQAEVAADLSTITFQTNGLNGYLTLNNQQQLKQFRLSMRDFSGLPASWSKYMTNAERLKVDIRSAEDKAWEWLVEMQADDGVLSVPSAHIQVPVTSLLAEGKVALKAGEALQLKKFEARSVQWKDKKNFGDFAVLWQHDILHIVAKDGATTMPMLWSWLWMLGDESWHQWLQSMKHGRVEHVKATLDLDWQNPLHAAPTEINVASMMYEVEADARGADIALGLGNDFLHQLDASVYINQDGLKAAVSSAVLNDDIGKVGGEYGIVWDTLMMDIQAKGLVDAGRLHGWLSPDSAEELHWGKAKAIADVRMKWDVDKDAPDSAIAHIKPLSSPWKLKPKGVPLTAKEGLVIWDINKGLTIQDMSVESPWFIGELSMGLDANAGWALVDLSLSGEGELQNLTTSFGLPIMNPQGTTSFNVAYQQKIWSGYLDLSANDWDSFAGYDKLASEELRVSFSGKPTTNALLPIKIDDFRSEKEGFLFQAVVGIDEKKIDFKIADIETTAIQGDLRILVPFDEKLSWGLEAKTSRIDKALFSAYLKPKKTSAEYKPRPLNAYVNTEVLAWDKMSAKGLSFQYSSDKKSTGSLKAASAIIGDADLKNVLGSFTVLEQGKIDVHNLEADGSGQHVVISGSATPLDSGILAWNGLALVQGEFGTLMKQAELNKLFQDGKMTSLFMGKGEFKEGEPWWRGLKGSFRLRVDDGRIIEGGTLTHLLAAISLIDLPKYLVFKRSDVVGKGLLYEKLQIEGIFDAELLNIHKLGLHSSALDAGGNGTVNLKSGEMDVLLVARPWQNVEAIVSYIPLLGYILTGEDKSFLRKVYRIHGPASDAAVDELDPKDAGLPSSGLLETLISLPSQWFGE